jgi:O-antigen ligase
LQKTNAAQWLPASAVCTLGLALTLGGAARSPGDFVVELSALLTLGLACRVLPRTPLTPAARGGIILAAVAFALPLVQLLPLPASLAGALPGRADLARELASIGADGLSHASLATTLTERSLWALLPGVALFAAGLALPPAWRQRLLALVVTFALASVVLGFAQVAGGPNSSLRFYEFTHATDAVGFFANRNHFASLLYVALVLGVSLLAVHWRRGTSRPLHGALGATVVVFCLVGLGLARSRMGLLLGMLAMVGAAAILTASSSATGRVARRWALATTTIGVLAVVQISLYGILNRLQADPLDDARWTFFANTRALATAYAPVGSGLGTFVAAYQSSQTPQQQQSFFANHAHNDYLELALETGWPAIGWMVAFALWWLWCTVAAWRHTSSSALLARGASLALGLLMLHATVDYALRTEAMLAVAGLLCAVLLPSVREHLPVKNIDVTNSVYNSTI